MGHDSSESSNKGTILQMNYMKMTIKTILQKSYRKLTILFSFCKIMVIFYNSFCKIMAIFL